MKEILTESEKNNLTLFCIFACCQGGEGVRGDRRGVGVIGMTGGGRIIFWASGSGGGVRGEGVCRGLG